MLAGIHPALSHHKKPTHAWWTAPLLIAVTLLLIAAWELGRWVLLVATLD